MSRVGKELSPSEKTAVIRKTTELSDWLMRKLCQEEVFPKRSRWLISGKIADLINDLETYIHLSNEIRVVTTEERDKRHYYQTMAIATLMALDVKVNTAQRILDIDPEKLHHYATLANDLHALLRAWMTADERRYGSPTGLMNTRGGSQ